MDDIQFQITQLIQQAQRLADGNKVKVELLTQAAELADSHQYIELQYKARLELVEAGTFSGYGDRAFAAFVWCLSQTKQSPDRFPIQSLLWKFKYVLSSVTDFATIAHTQIEAIFAEMANYYRQTNHSLRPVFTTKAHALLRMGHIDSAMIELNTYKKHSRDYYADCAACETDLHAQGLFAAGDFAGGLKMAEPILQGRQQCSEVPHITYGAVLLPLLRLNRQQEAQEYHLRGYALIANNRTFLSEIAKHLLFCSYTQQWQTALEITQRHFLWAIETNEVLKRLEFYIAALGFMSVMNQQHAEIELVLPAALPFYNRNNHYLITDITNWLSQQSYSIAKQFDTRNQNTFYAERINLVRSGTTNGNENLLV